MMLKTMRLLPRGDNGWTSGELKFGETVTVLLGPNGAGKTPILRALFFVLGHPAELPPLVREKCVGVELTLSDQTASYTLVRLFTPGVDATASASNGEVTKFTDEETLSCWVIDKIGLPFRNFMGLRSEVVPPYMSVAGPMFLVDQDVGWNGPYSPYDTHRFVKDQREEVARWFLDVPPRNRALDKTTYKAARQRLAVLQEQIAFKRRGLEVLRRELGQDQETGAMARLRSRKDQLELQLRNAQAQAFGTSEADMGLELRVREAIARRDDVMHRLSNAKRRRRQFREVDVEVRSELEALEQNEVAASAFRTLCSSTSCQFFRTPEASFGRRVLYLKDQLKDFESSSNSIEQEIENLRLSCGAAEEAVQAAIAERKSVDTNDSPGGAIQFIESATKELSDTYVRIDRLERIEKELAQLEALVNREARAVEEVEALKPSRGGRTETARLLDARQHLASTFAHWLEILGTPNVSTEVASDENLRVIVDGERFSSRSFHSGSTRTRLVLAYHAALVHTSIIMKGNHPRVLVLDAPRQHELDAGDLKRFIEQFQKLVKKSRIEFQLVFSATDAEVVPQAVTDRVWEPSFREEERLRYLGTLAVDGAESGVG